MWKFNCLILFLAASCSAGPLAQQRKNMPVMAREDSATATVQESDPNMGSESEAAEAAPLVGTLTLPSNATSIRADITDNFSCANKSYGYYADVENDCQIFHVCLPVTYADGKENTFRWSFICPEETIFSQESFTCMRREDMTIECEDSFRYYELNSNFGLPAEEENQPAAAATAAATAAAIAENEPEPAPESDQQQPQSELSEVAAPEPTVAPAKPVKVQKPKPKPNRRKPAVTYNKPQRKVPVTVTAAPLVEAAEEPEPEPEPEVVPLAFTQQASKPVKPQRFSVRPNKERPQAVKPAVPATATPIRNELFNSIRKRPAIFNKNSNSKPVQESEPAAVTEAIIPAQAELSEPQPTLKLQTMLVEPVQPEEPIAEASEPEPVLVIAQPEPEKESEAELEVAKPQVEAEQTKVEVIDNVDEVKPIEAIPEIPAVIIETMNESPQEQPVEQPVEEPVEQPAAEEQQKQEVVPEQTPIEPAIEESSSSNEEALNNIEALEAAKPADAPVSLPATPEMTKPNPIVEQMLDNSGANNEVPESLGGFKPVDPVMAAEAEQLITDFLNTLRKHEHEKTETELANAAMDMAETVEKQPQIQESDATLATEEEQKLPAETDAVSIEEAKLPEPEIVDKNASVEEQLLESEPQLKRKQDSPIINIMQLNHLPADYQIPVQVVAAPEVVQEAEAQPEPVQEAEAQPEPVQESETQPESVQEAEALAEPDQAEAAQTEAVQNEAVQNEAAQESLATAAYMPSISIDDIVELVKERLDQNPKNDQLAPMELVLTPGAAAPMTLIESSGGDKSEAVEAAEPVAPEPAPVAAEPAPVAAEPAPLAAEPAPVAAEPAPVAAEEQELILPIYKRVSIADPAPETVSKVEAETTPEQPEQEAAASEVREPKSQSRMDARKRRFLFRADAS